MNRDRDLGGGQATRPQFAAAPEAGTISVATTILGSTEPSNNHLTDSRPDPTRPNPSSINVDLSVRVSPRHGRVRSAPVTVGSVYRQRFVFRSRASEANIGNRSKLSRHGF